MDKRVQVYIMEMEQDASTRKHDSFDGNEFIHVLTGKITVDVEEKSYSLNEGESLYFHGSFQHVLKAIKPSKIVFLSIYSF